MPPDPLCDPDAPDRRVTWLELFFDLAFVAAVAHVGSPLAEDYTAAGLLRYGLLFFLIWWAWNGHTNFATRFDTGDGVQRSLALVQIFVVAAMAVNATDGLDTRSSAGFAAAYAVLRILLVAQYLHARHDIGARARKRRAIDARRLAGSYALGFGIASVCWLASAIVPVPARYWVWGLALAIDVGTPIVTAQLAARVPPHPAHLPERFGLFTIILLGESVVAVTKAMERHDDWSAPAALSAFLGMSIAFLIWWLYFDRAGAADHRVIRSPQQARRFLIWNFAHLPLYLGIGVAGVGIEHLIVIARDAHVHEPEVWILSCAATVVMLALTSIAATSDDVQRHPQRWRTLRRQYAVAAVPLTFPALSASVPPVAIVAGLAAVLLAQVVMAVDVTPLHASGSAAQQATKSHGEIRDEEASENTQRSKTESTAAYAEGLDW